MCMAAWSLVAAHQAGLSNGVVMQQWLHGRPITPKTSQKADVRPISFLLDDRGSIARQVMLPVRPEDLTRNEPSRMTVHQTLGRETTGWVDSFGKGLASITIAGTTGWRYNPALGVDGYQSFEELHDLIVNQYPKAVQSAIDAGHDPAGVKLLFVDLLDNFTYPVVLQNFVLRRSKSRPLLFQYNISMQAVADVIDTPAFSFPITGSISSGLGALESVTSDFDSFLGNIEGWINGVSDFAGASLAPLASAVQEYTGMVNAVLKKVDGVARAAGNVLNGPANQLINIASDLAGVGLNVTRTITSINNIPASLKTQLGQVSSAYNEVVCIFSNSLRPTEMYEQYDSVFGASNCSSTTGGRRVSAFTDGNVFEAIYADVAKPVTIDSAAFSAITAINAADPVLAPLQFPEMSRLLNNITSGIRL